MKMRDQLLPFAEENLCVLEKSGSNPKLADALRSCIKSYKYQKIINQLNVGIREFLDSPQGAQFVSGRKNSIFKSLWGIDREWLFREVFKEKLKKMDQKFLFGIVRRLYDTSISK